MPTNKKLHVVVIAAADLPEGGGESTRLKTLVNAISAAGHTVNILLENPSGNVNPELLQPEGQIGDVPFQYVLGNVHPLTGFKFFVEKYKAVQLLLAEIRSLHKQQKVDVVWFNQMAFHTIYPITRLCRKLGIKIIHSYEDERVAGAGLKRRLIYFNQTLADKYTTRMADAIVVISHYLREKYARLTKGTVPIEIIPTIVRVSGWNVSPENNDQIPVMLYYGGFFGFDDIEKMILAVKELKQRNVPLKFYLVGYNRKKPEYMEQIANFIQNNGVSDIVELKGFTPHAQLKQYLDEANILIGLRTNDEWSQTGLSTKLSEYLSTGRVVICSAVGDNTKYLTDGDNAVIVSPECTVEQLANAIELVIKDPDLRRHMGQNGKNVALTHFDMEVLKCRINDMLQQIV